MYEAQKICCGGIFFGKSMVEQVTTTLELRKANQTVMTLYYSSIVATFSVNVQVYYSAHSYSASPQIRLAKRESRSWISRMPSQQWSSKL